MMKCFSCGKIITKRDVKSGNAVVVMTEFGHEIYCGNQKCLDAGKIDKVETPKIKYVNPPESFMDKDTLSGALDYFITLIEDEGYDFVASSETGEILVDRAGYVCPLLMAYSKL